MVNRKLPNFVENLIVRVCCICLYSLLLVSCASQAEPKETEIVIISFSDIHGCFDNLAKISAFIKEAKTQYEHVIVADAGDRFTGNPYNDFYVRGQYPIYDLLNALGLDIAVVGNHEFDFGAELLVERMLMANFTEVLANIEVRGTVFNRLIKPYHVIEKGDISVGFLGLVCVDRQTGKTPALFEHVKDFTFYDPFETARNYTKSLRKKPDIYIALTHLGIRDDYRLADSVPEFDLIIGGHSHYLTVEPEFRNNVKVLNTDRRGDHVFKTIIRMKGRDIYNIQTELIAVSILIDEDPVIVEMVQHYEDNPFLATSFVTLRHSFNEEQLGLMVVDAALDIPNVDLSILNCGGIRADTLKAGQVTYGDILRVYPFSNHYVIIGLTPAEMREVIEWEFSIPKRCNAHPGGFHYVVDLSDENNPKVIEMTYPNGEKLDEDKVYQVALNNFLTSRHFYNRQNRVSTPVFVFDNIVKHLQSNPNVNYRNAPKRAKRVGV